MAIYDYLPKYNYIEPNNLKGLQPGFVVAQMPVASAAVNGLTVDSAHKMVENGTIVDISVDGIIAPTTTSKNLFIVYNEPLNTVFDSPKFYAVNLEEEHVRAVQLIPGDEWMSTKALDLSGALSGRIVEVTSSTGMYASDDWFACSTMANGDAAHHYVFIG